MREVFVAVVHDPRGNRWCGPKRDSYEKAKADLPSLLDEVVGRYTRKSPPNWFNPTEWAELAQYVYGEIQKRFYVD